MTDNLRSQVKAQFQAALSSIRERLKGRPSRRKRASFEARDPFVSGTYPLCPATHDLGIRRLFDLSTLIMLLDCRPGDRVLDLGAGPGFSSEVLAKLGYEVFAVDVDLPSLRSNRQRMSYDRSRIAGNIRVIQADVNKLPLAPESCDGVLGMNVLHHLSEVHSVTCELERVMKPGTRAVFCEPGLDHLKAIETQKAIREYGEDDKSFDVLSMLDGALQQGFSEAMLTATLQPALRLLPVHEIPLYLSRRHPRPQLTPEGVIDELHRRHAFAMLVKRGVRPKTSRHPGDLWCELRVNGIPPSARPGDALVLKVEALNTGDTTWLARPSTLGGFVTIGCKFARLDGRLVSDTVGRTFLDADVMPGESIAKTVVFNVPASAPSDTYQITIDMVDELICWFSDVRPENKHSAAIQIKGE